MKYVLGIDLGTSAVKVNLMNELGLVVDAVSKEYPLSYPQPGFSEQAPQDWVTQTEAAIKEIVARFEEPVENIVGISYSGQMHGLVLVDNQGEVLRPAILWNDTRTTAQCQTINEVVGAEKLVQITKNKALEGFTLPKILWVKENEPVIFEKAAVFLLPKDYVRFVMTGEQHMDFSDAAGTLLLDIEKGEWSNEILQALQLDAAICPPLVPSTEEVGAITSQFAAATGLAPSTKVYAGGADNACGAVGSGIVNDQYSMVSIGTSGVLLSYEATNDKDFKGDVHYFNHAVTNAYYTMGVTLSAGHSLSWYKDTFAANETFEEMLAGVEEIPSGSNGLLYTPYLVGERTPYADAKIRASFIGMDATHTAKHFTRSVMEGIIFSLRDSLEIVRASGKQVDRIISIGGGAKNTAWLQMQADIFNAKVYKLKNEQGPSIGACLIAAVGAGIYASFDEAVQTAVAIGDEFVPNEEAVATYDQAYKIYQKVYAQTKELNEALFELKQ